MIDEICTIVGNLMIDCTNQRDLFCESEIFEAIFKAISIFPIDNSVYELYTWMLKILTNYCIEENEFTSMSYAICESIVPHLRHFECLIETK